MRGLNKAILEFLSLAITFGVILQEIPLQRSEENTRRAVKKGKFHSKHSSSLHMRFMSFWSLSDNGILTFLHAVGAITLDGSSKLFYFFDHAHGNFLTTDNDVLEHKSESLPQHRQENLRFAKDFAACPNYLNDDARKVLILHSGSNLKSLFVSASN